MATGVGDFDLEGAITLELCCHRGSYSQTGGITDIVRRDQVIAQASTNTLKKYINKIFVQMCFFINILQFQGYVKHAVFQILYRNDRLILHTLQVPRRGSLRCHTQHNSPRSP